MNTELLSLLEKDARLTPRQVATMPSREEKDVAAGLFALSVKLVSAQKLLADKNR